MAGGYFGQAGAFLVEAVFGLYIIALLLRFLLARVRADFYNPFSQFIVRLTDPPLKPLRRLIPGVMGIDWALITLLIVVQALEIGLIAWLFAGRIPAPPGLAALTLAHLLKTLIYIYIFIIIAQVIISWLNPGAYNPVTVIMYQLSESALTPVRRLIPPAGGFDWAPLALMIILNLALILLVSPLLDLGRQLA